MGRNIPAECNCTFANQRASGADSSLWLYGASVFAAGAIFLASVKNGVGGRTKMDMFSMVTSLTGVALWVAFNSPLLSIIANLFATIVAVTPTILKARRDPEPETRIAFLLGGVSSAMGAVSVDKFDLNLLILPIAGFFIQAYIVYLLYLRPRRSESKKSP